MAELQPIICEHDGDMLKGKLAIPAGEGPFPAVLVMHSALGLRHIVGDVAARLAGLGYLAVATDMYGEAADISAPEKAGEHYMALLQAPERLRARTAAWYDLVAARADVDAGRIAAIGYCFGGKCVMELARSGRDVKAAVSYHGLLTTHASAKPGDIKGHVAAYCGADDPFGPHEETDAFRLEMIAAGARWQITEFGQVAHGFTDPAAEGGMPGIQYDALADKASWAGTLTLLEEVFT
jgi:dienelactone hydrolase